MEDLPSHSIFDSAGTGSESIAALFYWMLGGGVVIWCVVIGLAIYAIRSQRPHHAGMTKKLVIGGGAIIPTFVLTGLLAYGLSMMPELHRPAPPGSPRIRINGVRWWWRVQYELDDSPNSTVEEDLAERDSESSRNQSFETANEIYLPVNQPIQFLLESEDVIHSFWIPSIGGKMDMIPGRQNSLTLTPKKEGIYRGFCAEYCGTAHAQMHFIAVVVDKNSYQRWLRQMQAPAAEPQTDLEKLGGQAFLRHGCSACHTIRGIGADGVYGPDLTHFGSRRTIGAGIKANTDANLADWIVRTHEHKPGVEMPGFTNLGDPRNRKELQAIVIYLRSLK